MLKRFALSLAIVFLFLAPASAHKPTDAPHQTFAMGDLLLQSGEHIRDFTLSYVTHGTLNAAKDNAVLMLAPFVGNHHHNEAFVGKGKAFDTDHFFVICADPVGNGLTTSPSTSTAQPGMRFPRFSILDMVESQHRLIAEHFGITKLAAVTGASMGGMQSLQWAVRYPDSVANVVAIVPAARTSPWTRTLMELQYQAITLDPAWNNGEYSTPPEKGLRLWAGMLFGIAMNTPQSVNARTEQSPEKGAGRLTLLQDVLWNLQDANDILAQIRACESFDLGNTPGFDGNTQKALAAIKARTLILLGENDLVVPDDLMAEDAASIPDATVVWIRSDVPLGHIAGTGNIAMDFKQKTIADFMEKGRGK